MQRWEWRHPDAGGLGPRSVRWFAVSAVLVLAAMAAAGYSERDADPVGLVLSVLVGPGLLALLLFGGGWMFYVRPARFSLVATPDGVLHVGPSGRRRVHLAGATDVVVREVSTTTATTGGRVVSGTAWTLAVTPAQGRPLSLVLPGSLFGARRLTPPEGHQLEQQLRWMAGLPATAPR